MLLQHTNRALKKKRNPFRNAVIGLCGHTARRGSSPGFAVLVRGGLLLLRIYAHMAYTGRQAHPPEKFHTPYDPVDRFLLLLLLVLFRFLVCAVRYTS